MDRGQYRVLVSEGDGMMTRWAWGKFWPGKLGIYGEETVDKKSRTWMGPGYCVHVYGIVWQSYKHYKY